MLVDDVVHEHSAVRQAASEGLASAITQHPDQVDTILQLLLSTFEEKLFMPPPEFDALGRLLSKPAVDQWPARCGIAMAICKLSPSIPDSEIETLFQFFVEKGLADRAEEVRKEMLNAAVAALNDHSKVSFFYIACVLIFWVIQLGCIPITEFKLISPSLLWQLSASWDL